MHDRFGVPLGRALDAGCGPGRTALEFCKQFSRVWAYDYSEGFVANLLGRAEATGVTNLVARAGDSHKQEEVFSRLLHQTAFNICSVLLSCGPVLSLT